MVLIKKEPPHNRKLLVVGTTSSRSFADMTELTPCFNLTLTVPEVSDVSHFRHVLLEQEGYEESIVDRICGHGLPPMGVKRLLLVAEMARQACSPEPVRPDAFLNCLRQAGFD
jgi:vesicle-fusing ATPase